MTLKELGTVLRDMYQGAAYGDQVVMIHLFAVKYAEQIAALNASCKDVALAAGMSESYGTEINKGVHLAKYVEVKRTA